MSIVAKPRKRHGHAWLALAGYLLLTLGLTYPLVTQFGRAIPGDGFDGWQNYWNLWWIKTAVLEQHTHPWLTHLLYYPTGVGLLFHTLNAFNGFITLPIQLAFGLLPAYNAAVLFSFTLGGLGAYLLARYILGSRSSHLAAFAAGVIFTFSPFHIAHLLGHMQVISLEWIPFYALYLLKTVQCGLETRNWTLEAGGATRFTLHPPRPIWHNGLLAALFLTLVALCDWYYVLYCLILTAVVVVWVLLRFALRRRAATESAVSNPQRPFPLTRTRPHPGNHRCDLAALGRPAQPGAHPDAPRSRPVTFHGARPGAEPHPVGGSARFRDAAGVPSAVGQVGGGAGQAIHRVALRASGFRRVRRAGAGRAGCAARMARQEAGAGSAAWVGLWLLALLTFVILALGPVLHIGGQTALLPGGGEIPLPYTPGWCASCRLWTSAAR